MSLTVTHIESIAQVVQLAVAPVFLLAGVGATLNVLVGRLARIVDRARLVEAQFQDITVGNTAEMTERLAVLATRARLISRAIAFSVLCAVMVPIVVVSLFISVLLQVNLAVLVAVTFIIGLVSLAIGLVYFMREIFVATAALNFGVHRADFTATQRLRRVLKRS